MSARKWVSSFGLLAAPALVVGVGVVHGMPASPTEVDHVLTFITTGVVYRGPAAVSLTMAHLCPEGTVLDVATTRRRQAEPPPASRLVSRRYVSHGVVSTWRLPAQPEVSGRSVVPDQTVVCAQTVSAGALRQSAVVRVTIRLSGSVPAGSAISSFHTTAATWDEELATSMVRVDLLAEAGLGVVQTGTDNPNQAFASGTLDLRGRGHSAPDVVLALRVTSDRPWQARHVDDQGNLSRQPMSRKPDHGLTR